jgi:hypothetical protein
VALRLRGAQERSTAHSNTLALQTKPETVKKKKLAAIVSYQAAHLYFIHKARE